MRGAPFLVLWLIVTALAGCAGPAPVAPDAAAPGWRCPATWVAHARGGCGPAALLCAPDGGAAAGACEGVDLSRAPVVSDGDGGVAAGFWRAPDGALRGAWREPGEPDGPPTADWHPPALDGLAGRVPAADWSPDAGIPSCPAGWARTGDGVCDPRVPTDCPEGSGALPGGLCTRTAERDCPAGEWADPGPEGVGATVLRVREGADDARADGGAERPFGTIRAALAAAPAGAWVLVAAGRYAERVTFERSVHLVGACAARATIAEPLPYDATLVLAVNLAGTAPTFELRGFTLRTSNFNVAIQSGARATLRALRITNATAGVVSVGEGTAVAVEDLLFEGPFNPTPAAVGAALLADGASTITASRVHVARAAGVGVLARAATLDLRDAVVRDLRATPLRLGNPTAVAAIRAGVTHATRVVVPGAPMLTLGASGVGSLLVLEDVVATGAYRIEGIGGGFGLAALVGARVEARRALLADHEVNGVLATSRGSVLLEDSVVRGTRGVAGVVGGFGVNLAADTGGRLDVRGVVSARAAGASLSLSDVDTEARVERSVVRDTLVGPDERGGVGVIVRDGALCHARRVAVERSAAVGAVAFARGALLLEDSVVRDTRAASDLGLGLNASGEGRLDVERVRVAGAADVGALADSRGVLTLRDAWLDAPAGAGRAVALYAEGGASLVASRVRAGAGHRAGARASGGVVALQDAWFEPLAPAGEESLVADGRGTLRAARVRVEGARSAGCHAQGAGARVALEDAVIDGVYPTQDGARGFGALGLEGGALALTRTLVRGAQEAGVVARDGASLALDGVAVLDTRARAEGTLGYGALVLGGGASLRRVVLRGNHDFGLVADEGAAVDARDLAVFDTAAVFDGTDSAAIGARGGARVTLARALLAGNAHSAVIARDPGTRFEGADLVVMDTRPTRLGFGVGVGASEGAAVSLARAAVVGSGGFAVGAVRRVAPGATLAAGDLYVAGVADRAVRNAFPQGPAVAYGVAVGAGCGVTLARAAVAGAGWGFFQTAGSLRWSEGVIVAPRDGPGCVSGAGAGDSALDRVAFVESPVASVARDLALPEVLLPPPPAPCALPPCGSR